jgi:uncharacterized membrane protein
MSTFHTFRIALRNALVGVGFLLAFPGICLMALGEKVIANRYDDSGFIGFGPE